MDLIQFKMNLATYVPITISSIGFINARSDESAIFFGFSVKRLQKTGG